jgi:hypothetical protein
MFLCSITFLFLGFGQLAGQLYELEFSSAQFSVGKPIELKKGDSLNLTCKVTSVSTILVPRFKITIRAPFYSRNRYVQ